MGSAAELHGPAELNVFPDILALPTENTTRNAFQVPAVVALAPARVLAPVLLA